MDISYLRYGIRKGIKECYIDCIPSLLPYYKALGFAIAGPKFFHRENGPSHPMRLDLVKHGEALSNETGMREYVSLVVKAQAIRLIVSSFFYTGIATTIWAEIWHYGSHRALLRGPCRCTPGARGDFLPQQERFPGSWNSAPASKTRSGSGKSISTVNPVGGEVPHSRLKEEFYD
jgi:hypothetical protein